MKDSLRSVATIAALIADSIFLVGKLLYICCKYALLSFLKFYARRAHFLMSCMFTLCATGMLYGAIVTPSPLKTGWTVMCVMMVVISCITTFMTWKEE